ncbi:MAG TPA: ABC transporter permease subunit [Actinomycetota bacterium]|nr:ABC transporter permease subunit [Actinomycetota bacterium]
MIWLVWRQHRLQALFAVLGLAVLAAFLVPTGLQMRHAFDRAGLDDCLPKATRVQVVEVGPGSGQGNGLVGACKERADQFTSRFGYVGNVGVLLWFLPLLAGLFWGAPLVAREFEHGTHRLVWTQGVSRKRWALAKFGLVGGGVVLLAAGFALLVTWWRLPLDQASGRQYLMPGSIYDLIGPVPIGYALFALALGVLAGVLTRRTQAAMAVTLVGFLVTRIAAEFMVRPNLLSPARRIFPVAGTTMPNDLVRDWIVSAGVYSATGRRLDGGTLGSYASQFCGPQLGGKCEAGQGAGTYNQELFFSPDRIWLVQGIETALFVALAVLLLLAAVQWIRRRRLA